MFCSHKATPQRYYVATYIPGTWYAVSTAVGNAKCHVIIPDTTGTTYVFYEIDKRKETLRTRRQIEREKEKKMIEKREETIVVPPPSEARWPTLEK